MSQPISRGMMDIASGTEVTMPDKARQSGAWCVVRGGQEAS